jgi:NADH-quinone oxidoreductase subunit C
MISKEFILNKLQGNFPETLFQVNEYRDELSLTFPKALVVELCSFLKNDPELKFNLCEDITAVDWAQKTNRFTVVYHIFSMVHNYRLVLKTDVDESECALDSVSNVWRTANWHEREVYDMFGISFNNHPDLRRMYMPEEFEYHPLRKDFPLMGIPGSLPLPEKN